MELLSAAGHEAMSRRKVSVKALGQVDCHGWLYKKKEARGFLGSKWKKYWFVLKKTSLYWYTCEMAEKAEGYINLADFTINQAKECKKKHAMKASHPKIVTLFFAAESLREMNKWLAKISVAATKTESSETNTGECYSEASDQEEEESTETSCPLYSEQLTSNSVDEDDPPPCSMSPPPHTPVHGIATMERCEVLSTEQTEPRLEVPPLGSPLSPPGLPGMDGGPEGQGEQGEDTSDELRKLFVHLRDMRISPTGQLRPFTHKDFRASFIRRCKDDKINDKLHLVRTLNSTLKAKEADLSNIEQMLKDPTLTALKYREWKDCNVLLVQEIIERHYPPGGSSKLPVRVPKELCVTKTV